MAQESWPFDEANLAEDDWSRLARNWQDSGVIGDPSSTGLQVSGNSSGMQVSVTAGDAVVRGHGYRNTAAVIVPISANASGSARIDRVVVRLGPTTRELHVIEGVGTAVPSLEATDTGLYDIPLGQVRVEPGAVTIAANKVTDDRRFTGTRILPVLGTASVPSPRIGQQVFDYSSATVKVWSGSGWRTLPFADAIDAYGAWTPNVQWAAGSLTFSQNEGWYARLPGGFVSAQSVTTILTRTGGTTPLYLMAPASAKLAAGTPSEMPLGTFTYFDSQTGGRTNGVIVSGDIGQPWCRLYAGGAYYNANPANGPWAGDSLATNWHYRAA